jgi:hypothetical protein
MCLVMLPEASARLPLRIGREAMGALRAPSTALESGVHPDE